MSCLYPFSDHWTISAILRSYPSYRKTLNEYLEPVEISGKPWRRCFRASEHSYRASAFHSACDNKGPTVVVVRVGSHVFGGYADASWSCECGAPVDVVSFIIVINVERHNQSSLSLRYPLLLFPLVRGEIFGTRVDAKSSARSVEVFASSPRVARSGELSRSISVFNGGYGTAKVELKLCSI